MLNLPLCRELLLDRPIAECYRYLADFSTTEQWDPGVFAADKTTPGAARAGSEFALRLNVLGRSVPAAYRLIERDENRRLVLEGSGPGFTVVDMVPEPPSDVTDEGLDAWLDENWDPDLTVSEWWQRLGTSGWAAGTCSQ